MVSRRWLWKEDLNVDTDSINFKASPKKDDLKGDIAIGGSDEQDIEKTHREQQKMRPYKKRVFQTHFENSENSVEAENSEDSEKQASSSPPAEDQDKDKEGETKKRKTWKRKISRKQFRHHDIKLFTPGEYRSTTLLKQIDTSPTVSKKSETGSKESITEQIVTSLGGQKQAGAPTKVQSEETTDISKNQAEENNNTNDIQNNNVSGKHHLPAIIIETPSIRRRSVDYTNVQKANSHNPEPKLDRRTSVDMPVIFRSEQITENISAHLQTVNIGRGDTSVKANTDKHSYNGDKGHKNANKANGNVSEEPRTSYNQVMSNPLTIQQNDLRQYPNQNGHGATSEKRVEHNQPFTETSPYKEPYQPEAAYSQLAPSTENPVDLRKKTASYENTTLVNPEPNANAMNYAPLNGEGDIAISRRGVSPHHDQPHHTRTSPNPYLRSTMPKGQEQYSQNQTLVRPEPNNATAVTMHSLDLWQGVLEPLTKQPFSVDVMELVCQGIHHLEKAKEEYNSPDAKKKVEKLLYLAYTIVMNSLKALNFNVNPLQIIHILGQSEETTVEKTTLKNYIDNMQRIKRLATSESGHATTPQEQRIHSKPSSYPVQESQPAHGRKPMENQTPIPPSPFGPGIPYARPEIRHIPPGYSNGIVPKPSIDPQQFAYPRHPLPPQPTTEHPLPPPQLTLGERPMVQASRGVPTAPNDGYPIPFAPPAAPILRNGMGQVEHRLPPNTDPIPAHYQHPSEPPRAGNLFVPPAFPGGPPVMPGVHAMSQNLPPHRPEQNHLPPRPNNSKSNPYLSQTDTKTKQSGAPARPRSKSHRTNTKNVEPQLKRSLSNPHYPKSERNIAANPYGYFEGPNVFPALNYSSNHSVSQPFPNYHPNREVSVSSNDESSNDSDAAQRADMFHRNLHGYEHQGIPMPFTLRPYPQAFHNIPPSTVRNTEHSEGRDEQLPFTVGQSNEPRENLVPKRVVVPSPTESKISSSTDHLQISKVTSATRPDYDRYDKVTIPDAGPSSSKQPEVQKSIPVAVIVADNSMQITKETAVESDNQQSRAPTERSDPRKSTQSNSNDDNSISDEVFEAALEQELEENSPEFLVWLEKLKKNEKLKSTFLKQMGIVKKEERPFTEHVGETIEIMDSDEEDLVQTQTDKDSQGKSENVSVSARVQRADEHQEIIIVPVTSMDRSLSISQESLGSSKVVSVVEVNKALSVSSTPSPKPSLSKRDYIPAISLPYVPQHTEENPNSCTTSQNSAKIIYTPEIEPISPAGNETCFEFPKVPNANLQSAITPGVKDLVSPDSVTSPSYKRKSPVVSTPYTNEDKASSQQAVSFKRQKSDENSESSTSPRVAPTGKLCYLRGSHMLFRYFDDTQAELFMMNLSSQDEELLRNSGIEPDRIKNRQLPSYGPNSYKKTEILYLPADVRFSEKEDLPEVEEFIKESALVHQFVPKDFADFYRYVTGFQIIKNKHPVSLQTFLTMYNTNRTSELLRKYLENL